MVHIVDMDQSNAIRFLHFCVPLRVAAFAPQSSFLRLLAYRQPSTGTAAHATSSSSSVAGARRRTWVHEVAAPTATHLLLAACSTCCLPLATRYSLLATRHSLLATYPQPRGEDLRVERRVRRRHDAPVHHEQQLAYDVPPPAQQPVVYQRRVDKVVARTYGCGCARRLCVFVWRRACQHDRA